MAQINLVTGYTGEAHVKSEDDAILTRFLLGTSSAVLTASESHTTTAFNVTGFSGIINGRLARIDEPVSFAMTPPASGRARTDAVYIVYSKNNNGIETAYLDYVKGDSTWQYSPPAAPSHGGVTESNLLVYEIVWTSAQTIKEVTQPPTAPAQVPLFNLDSVKYLAEVTLMNGNPFSTEIGYPTVYKIPLVGNSTLYVGVLTPSESIGVENNATVRVQITRPNGGFGGTVVAGGIDVNGGSSLGTTKVWSRVGSSKIEIDYKMVQRHTSATTDNFNTLQFVFWYITINDFE